MAKAIINGQEIFGNVHLGEGGDVANPNIADVYDPTQTYNTGDRRIYNDVLYVCNDDNVTGAWDSTKWDSATIDEIISALTAADIPYTSGVSVADMLDSLTTPILVTRTSYSGITDNTEIYKITDKIYTISINIINPTATSAWVNICDFPAPSFSNQYFTAVSTETNDSTYCQCFYISGNARLRISAPKASTYRGFMMLVIP